MHVLEITSQIDRMLTLNGFHVAVQINLAGSEAMRAGPRDLRGKRRSKPLGTASGDFHCTKGYQVDGVGTMHAPTVGVDVSSVPYKESAVDSHCTIVHHPCECWEFPLYSSMSKSCSCAYVLQRRHSVVAMCLPRPCW